MRGLSYWVPSECVAILVKRGINTDGTKENEPGDLLVRRPGYYLHNPKKTFSYVLNFHNLSKRHSEKFFFEKKLFLKKKSTKKLFLFFRFYFCFGRKKRYAIF